MNTCRQKNTGNPNASSKNEADENNNKKGQEPEQQHEEFYWNIVPGGVYKKKLDEAYNEIVYWRKSIFLVPTGSTAKIFIDEISRLLKLWTNGTTHKNIALKSIHVIPHYFYTSRMSKAKDHLKALERRLRLWEEGNVTELVNEIEPYKRDCHQQTVKSI